MNSTIFSILGPSLVFLFSCNTNPVHIEGQDQDAISPVILALPFHDQPSWSPDGRTIAYHDNGYVIYDPQNGTWLPDLDSLGIWFISPDGTDRKIFLNRGYAPEWSPDGQWIAFEMGDIYTVKANGDSLNQLTFNGGNYSPDWSPDGEWIAYDNVSHCSSYLLPENSCGIFIVRIDGSVTKRLVGGRYPGWHPDGRYVVFVGTHGDIFRVNVEDTSKVTQLSSFKGTDLGNGDNRHPQYSPDGSRIAFISTAYSPGLWVMRADGTNPRKLISDYGKNFSWSPDGERIVYVGPQHTLWIVNADGSYNRQLTFRPDSVSRNTQ